MDEQVLAQDTILLGEHAYALTLDIVIATAQQQLLIFDQDLSTGDFTSVKRFDLFHDFLNKSPVTQLTIVLQQADFFTTRCSRLLNLLTTFDHKMTIYETNDHAKIAKDCFILADDKAYIRRFHIDQARFKYALDDAQITASLSNRFDELLQETKRKIQATDLGL
jgi:hypothetical protein